MASMPLEKISLGEVVRVAVATGKKIIISIDFAYMLAAWDISRIAVPTSRAVLDGDVIRIEGKGSFGFA